MNARNDSAENNASLLSRWVYGAVRPIVRILRSAGISEAAICEAVKRASAQHEADALRGRLGENSRYESIVSLSKVTSAWIRQPQWDDGSGNPRDLAAGAQDPNGFFALVRATDPALESGVVLKELLELEIVALVSQERFVRLRQRSIVHATEDTFLVEPVLLELRRYAETLEHNTFSGVPGRLQLLAAGQSIDPAKFAVFANFVERTGKSWLESADDYLDSIAKAGDGRGANYGVGIFVFFEDASG